jgi:GH24 family phage-related lysozyme (muramidase)
MAHIRTWWWIRASSAALVLVAALAAAPPASARGDAASASCVSQATGAPRGCTIQGTLSGTHTYRSSTDDVTTTWNGTLVFRQLLPEHGPLRQLTYDLAPGSRISWTITGSAGGCAVSGSGTLDASRLTGRLIVGKPLRPGVWAWTAQADVRAPRSGEKLMPVTCVGADGDLAVGFAKGFQFLTTSLGEPTDRSRTDGVRFSGSGSELGDPTQTRTSWDMTGDTYATEISQYGLDFIKTWEGLPRCKGDRAHVCVYDDSVGNCTIGYGHLVHKKPCNAADQKVRWTVKEARDRLPDKAKTAEYQGVVQAFSRKYSLNQCQFDALMSFVWNAGAGGFNRLTRGLPLEGWQLELVQRLVTNHNTATVRNAKPPVVGKDKSGKTTFTFKDPNGKTVTVPAPTIGKGPGGGTTITFRDPKTGKLVSIPSPVATPGKAPGSVTLEGLVKRRNAEMRWFTGACPCRGAPGRTPSTWNTP